MNIKPASRQTQRTQTALKMAFVDLLKESNYDTISVGDITDRANIGRSTFYHHYNSKADLLVSWHEDIFQGFDLGNYTPLEWTNKNPPKQLIFFFESMKNSRMPFHNFGQDAMFVLQKVGVILTQQIEDNLKLSFPDVKVNIPFEVTAQSIAGIYVGIFQWWIMEHPPYPAEQMAIYTHQMICAAILASITQTQNGS
jgi:AcrR family transcriptional regulator